MNHPSIHHKFLASTWSLACVSVARLQAEPSIRPVARLLLLLAEQAEAFVLVLVPSGPGAGGLRHGGGEGVGTGGYRGAVIAMVTGGNGVGGVSIQDSLDP